MDKLGIRTAAVVGHSAGANVAVHMARCYPQRVQKLVVVNGLVAIPGGPPPFVVKSLTFPPLARWMQIAFRLQMKPAFFANAYADRRAFDPQRSAGFQSTLQTPGWDRALVATFRDSATNIFSAGELAHINTPTLIVWGAADRWVPLAIGERLRDTLPNATWRLYPAVGHFAMEEGAEMFNRDLAAFL